MKRVLEMSVADGGGARVRVRAVIDGIDYQCDMNRLKDELGTRLMKALADLPILFVPLHEVVVK